MSRPTVAIIGRPNVGKSTLFNRLVGKRLALVDDQPGVTRDRREGDAELLGIPFRIIDTAGFEDEDAASLPGRMRAQTEAAVREADVALFMVDARAGVTPLDEEVARWLRSADVPVVLLANKAEGRAAEPGILEAMALGLGDPVPFSAEHGEGIADLFEALLPHIDREEEEEAEDDSPDAPLKLAVVGRPNAGKSTLINRLIGQDRLITGPEAGITRDSIAIEWEWEDFEGNMRPVRLIDTAGMRKRAKVEEKLEKLSVADTLRSIDFAEVVVLLLDATRGLEVQDLKIADKVLQEGRALVIALNKWDVAENASSLFNGVKGALDEGLAQVKGVPLLTVSAATGKGLDTLIKVAFETREAWSRRITTGQLNRWFERALEANPPPAPGGKRIKPRYVTQAKTRPPSFILFGTRVDLLPQSYERYLVNSMRKEFGFGAVPVRLTMRPSKNPYDRE
ncbi:ribosome biogenesis GTPase Der [Sphingomonas koreensis]|jgi:GTP-binding protein|uniref:GTPase Der n=1 Tax=Sphingomonas koreensis TaxID=93064 RepID=A0A1L6JCB1_9SPHN|nr:ribosome biogenesis GTPase Der [Sphingomonas koreensis]APR53546.1 ribosome biogenesis GTPase Der [Sphingomonas koreensis]MDC7809735.1 ribosome biogenesis GTPase Der [Sphingomonas koreensis]PJI87082.1 GTP-binding protein [Sphingomonas koreensis]RSU20996.1 ribosome biogenesis GTPase Der [Sphingomonas koreensis]RSU22077.1 ribosome biogenesis GTPase Der [Sphingomonas koreensis]